MKKYSLKLQSTKSIAAPLSCLAHQGDLLLVMKLDLFFHNKRTNF